MAAKSKRAAPKSTAVVKSTPLKVSKTENGKSVTNGNSTGKEAAAVKAATSQNGTGASVTAKGKKPIATVPVVENKQPENTRLARSTKEKVIKPSDSSADVIEANTPPKEVVVNNPAKIVKGRRGKKTTDKNQNNIEDASSKDEKDEAEIQVKNGNGKAVANGTKQGEPMEEGADLDENIEEAVVPVVVKKVNNAKGSKNSAKVANHTAPSTSGNDVTSGDKKASKRKAESATNDVNKKVDKEPARKKQKTSIPLAGAHDAGFVLVVGSGETGQLGLGPDIMDRKRPAKVQLPASCVQVCAGGMHTVCLTGAGEVYTFGCNDEGALGRITPDDDECTEPARVEGLPEKIVQVSAGDSHTAALSETGKVYIWGVFRDANGPLGMFTGPSKLETPKEIDLLPSKIAKIASGTDHLACLTVDGDIYTLGCGEQGQLGRVAECFTVRGGRRGIDLLLKPALVYFPRKNLKMCDIWTGQYGTYAKSTDGAVYAWGLNNYYQLGFSDIGTKFNPVKSSSFESGKDWVSISGGQHHTLAIDGAGQVYSLGRKDYGRLGLGEEADLQDKAVPTLIPGLQSTRCSGIACGTAVSYAIGENGDVYSWGMGSGQQLGHGDDEDDVHEPKVIEGKQLEDKRAVMVTAGGQHMVLIAQDQS